MRRVVRIGLAAVAVAGIAVAVAAGVLLWRVTRGPIDVGFLRPRLEAALRSGPDPVQVRLGSLQLEWDREDRTIELRARDVRVSVPGTADTIDFTKVAVQLRVRALLRGALVFNRVEIVEPRIRVVWRPDGSVGLALDTVVPNGAHELPPEAVGAVLPEPDVPVDRVRVRTMALHDGVVTLVDPQSGLTVTANHVNAEMERTSAGMVGQLTSSVSIGDASVDVDAQATYHRDARNVSGRLHVADVIPATAAKVLAPVAAGRPAVARVLAALAPVALPVDTTVDLAFDAAQRLQQARVTCTGAAGTLTVPGLAAPLRVGRARLVAAADLGAGRYDVEEAELALGEATVRAQAHVTGTPRGTLAASASVDALPTATLATYWPPAAVPDARAWVLANINRGTVRDLRVTLAGTVSPDATPAVSVGSVSGTFAFQDLSVRYLPSMPPVTGVAGTSVFSAAGLEFTVAAGRLADLTIPRGTVRLSGLAGVKPRLAVDADVEGPLATSFRVLDAEPVRLAKTIGIAAGQVGGTMQTRLQLDMPLAGASTLSALGLAVTSTLRDVSVRRIAGDWSLARGELSVELDSRRVALAGTGNVQGVPVRGTMQYPFDKGGTLRADLKGRVDRAGRAALGLDPGAWFDGPVDVVARLGAVDGAPNKIDVEADLRDATLSLGTIAPFNKPAGTAGTAVARLSLRDGTVAAIDRVRFAAAGGELTGSAVRGPDPRRWVRVDAALVSPGSTRGATAHTTLTVRPGAGAQPFTLESDDAGAVAQLLGSQTVRGGTMVLAGTVDTASPRDNLDSRLSLRGIRIRGAPWLLRLATLASLSGLQDAVSNGRLVFDRAGARLALRWPTLSFTDGVATASSLGLRADGTLQLESQRVQANGTLIPSYYGLNEGGTKLPIIGGLIGAVTGGALQAFDFGVTGAMATPDVKLQASSLAPGALRDLVRKLER